MAYQNAQILAFNRGIISPRALGRIDMKRLPMSSEIQNNFIPRVLGSQMLRPGLEYKTATYNNKKSLTVPFVYSLTDTAQLELTDQLLRPLVNDAPITRVSVGTALGNSTFLAYVTNGTFATNSGWTFNSGWSWSAGFANATTASTALQQNCPVTLVSGKNYSITYTVALSAGSVTPSIGGQNGTTRSAAGTYTETITASSTQVVAFTGSGFTGSISAVSILPLNVDFYDVSDAGGTSTLGGPLSLVGTGFAAGQVEQFVTVAGADQNKEHAIRIVVARGTVTFSVGTASKLDDYISRQTLGTGTHSLAFTPTGNFYINIGSITQNAKQVTSCAIEGAGVLTLPAPWLEADLFKIRWDASASVTYLACFGYQQRKIERRATRSWSIVLYEPQDGPFRVANTTTVTLTPSALNGDITLTASRSMFYSTHVGALFKLTSTGQVVDATFTGDGQFGNPIEVTGTGTQRAFTIVIGGTFTATIQLQMSVGQPGAWIDVSGKTFTIAGTSSYNDGLNGQTIYYRLGIKTGNYTSGTATTEMQYSSGSLDGIVKITGYTSPTVVSASVIQSLGSTTATPTWKEGDWSNYRGWPSEMKLHEGRMFNLGFAKIWGSLPDAYESWDETVVGDGGAINRSFGKGPVDQVQWAVSLQRLVIGAQLAEWSCRSNSLDDPLTPSNITTRSPSTQGSAQVPAVQIDTRAVFVQKSGIKLYQMQYASSGGYLFDYQSEAISDACPELFYAGIKKIVVQRQPDTRIHCVLNDGTVVIVISQPAEEVLCFITVTTTGTIEDAHIMPGTSDGTNFTEDAVYYQVARTVQGSTVRYHEKWALETECIGGNLNKQADSFVTYTGAPSNTITAAHLKGVTGVIWGDGKDLGTATADASTGVVTLPNGVTASNIVFGIGYIAQFKSSKLAYGMMQEGSPLNQKKKIDHLGVGLINTHYQGVKFGPDFSNLYDLPQIGPNGEVVAADTIFAEYDADMNEFGGEWNTDSRLCIQAAAPRPCTLQFVTMGLETSG